MRGRKPTTSSQRRRAVTRYEPGESLGASYRTHLEAARLVQAGLPFAAVGRFQKSSGLTLDRIKRAARITEGSFARRKQVGHLSQEESERLLRLSRLFERATELFEGDREGARQWLDTSLPALDDQRPLDLAQSEPGAREVEDLIGRIEDGIIS